MVKQISGDWDKRIKLFRSDEVDTFAVITARYVVLIDTMSSLSEAQLIFNQIKDDLLDRKLLVINTHQHYDHAWGNKLFADMAPIFGHSSSIETATNKEALNLLKSKKIDPFYGNVEIFPPTITADNFKIFGGDLTLEVFETPGHTTDHLSIWIPEISTLIAGDAAEYPFPYVENPKDLADLVKSLEKMRTLKPKTVLLCHGGTIYPEILDQNLEYFNELKKNPKISFEEVLNKLNLTSPSDLYREFHRLNQEASIKN